MPPWILQLLVPVLVQVGVAIACIAVIRQQLTDVTRRVGTLESDKLDSDVYYAYKGAQDEKIAGAYTEISRERHRVNNLDQRTKGL